MAKMIPAHEFVCILFPQIQYNGNNHMLAITSLWVSMRIDEKREKQRKMSKSDDPTIGGQDFFFFN